MQFFELKEPLSLTLHHMEEQIQIKEQVHANEKALVVPLQAFGSHQRKRHLPTSSPP
jgi:hypothetical protein